MPAELEIRRLEADEAALHRSLRIAALRESPEAFGQLLSDVEPLPLESWVSGAHAMAAGSRSVLFVAELTSAAAGKREPIGMVYGLQDPSVEERSRVGGMWVAPTARRSGAGMGLLQAVLDWARARQSTHVALWAPEHSEPALRLYASAGFRPTLAKRPFPNRPGETIVELELALGSTAP